MIRKHIKKNIFTFALLLLPFAASAQEQSRLEVIFTPDPLFSEQDIVPGDSVFGTVEVTNNSGEDQTIITEAINVSDPDSLSDDMELVIVDNSADTFFDGGDGTFNDFLTSGPHTLTDPLSNGATVIYTFTVDFSALSGNETQNTQLGFDLCVGFLDELSGMNCGETSIGDEQDTRGGGMTQTDPPQLLLESPGGGGGGGPVDIVSLEISNERVISIDDVLGTALIAWETNLYSTSQVVYGITSEGPYSLEPLSENFGYPNATVEDENKVLSHTAVLTGLIPGEEYSYRVASRASPTTVSYQHNFVVEKFISAPAVPVQSGTSGGSEASSGSSSSGGSSSGTNASSNTSSGSVLAVSRGGSSSGTGNNAGSDETEEVGTSTEERKEVLEELASNLSEGDVQNENAENSLPVATEGFTAAAYLSGLFENKALSCVSFTALTLIVIYLTQLIYSKILQNGLNERTKNIIWLLGLLIGAGLMLIVGKFCSFVFLLTIFALLVAWNLYQNRDTQRFPKKRGDGILHKKPLS